MKIALLDLKGLPGGCDNKDQTGTYGSYMNSRGLMGRLFEIVKRSQLILPYLHFGYAAALLRRQGHEVRYFEELPQAAWDAAIFASSLPGHAAEIAAAARLKAAYPRTRIGFVGAFASARPDLFLTQADFVVQGEPLEFFLRGFGPTAAWQGIIPSGRVQDLDSLPFPDWDGFPVARFSYYPMLKARPVFPMVSSRGCPYGCYYCPYLTDSGPAYRFRSPEKVVNEMRDLVRTRGARGIAFRDAIFSYDQERVAEICQRLQVEKIEVAWGCETRSDCLSRELLVVMRQAGMRYLNLGIEAADLEVLKGIRRKPVAQAQQEEIIQCAEELGILVSAFYMLGSLAETRESAERTIAYACRIPSSLAQFDIMTAYPGTPFFDQVQDRLLDGDFSKFTTYSPTLRLDHLAPPEIEKLKARAYRQFYLRPAWWLRKAGKVLWQ